MNNQIIIYGQVDFILFSSLQHEFYITYSHKKRKDSLETRAEPAVFLGYFIT